MSYFSRKHEFEADAYSVEQTGPEHLSQALIKLHKDNASTLTPDPWYVRFYYSHPPAEERLAHLRAAAARISHAATQAT
jgi:STE24 endopeptidase